MTTYADRALLGLVIIFASLGVLVLVAIYASIPGPLHAETPPPDTEGQTYTCYCWRDPIPVRVVVGPSKGRAPARARHARHAARSKTHVSHAGAGGGGRGAPPVPATG
ncbi:hypothetical protein [Streptomyces sp. bgisy159]|uniref:hypothetical protein n=1 Tax=Streptomyces sp. bgisy159 TaxID=3413795 RepID=UPI003F4A5DEF